MGVPPHHPNLDHFSIETHGDDWGSISRSPPFISIYGHFKREYDDKPVDFHYL
jgi:hypothetical protein